MARQITHLKATQFLGLHHVDLTFGKPVSLFVGRNNQGKSSVRDALAFAFSGKCRGLQHFKDVSRLGRNGQDGMSVMVQFADGALGRTVKNASTNIEDNGSVVPYCLDPAAFIRLPAKERGKLLSGVLGGGMEELAKEALKQHVGAIRATVAAEIKASGVAMYDVDALHKAVVEIRKQYKRDLRAIADAPPSLADYELPEGFDAAKAAADVAKLAERINKGNELISAANEATMAQARMLDCKNAIRRAKEEIKPVPVLPADADEVKIRQQSVWAVILEETLKTAKGGKCYCPICNALKAIDTFKQRHTALSTFLQQYAGTMAERETVIAANAKAEATIAAQEEILKRLKPAAKDVDPPKNGQRLLDSLLSERDALQAQIAMHERFTSDTADYTKQLDGKAEIEACITECNRVDKALEDGGPVKSAIAAGGKQLPINKKLLEVWCMASLQWSDNGEIALHGRPIAMASESEKYRAACIMGLALASVGDVGFAALDGFEVLDGHNANSFFKAVSDCGLNNVFVFASAVKDWRKVPIPAGVEIFEVADGRIMKLRRRS